MKHIVLLGDSVFDNAAYEAGGPDVIEQVRERLPAAWRATLRAVDGSVVSSVQRQLHLVPPDASHLVISVGGNDALGHAGVLDQTTRSIADPFGSPRGHPGPFRTLAATGLTVLNDCITREAFARGLSLIDLRLICDGDEDFANPIEPSVRGGAKIAAAIAALVTGQGGTQPSKVFARVEDKP